MQKTNQTEFRNEKVIKRKSDKLYFKWKGIIINSWIDKKHIIKISEYFPKPNSVGIRVKVDLDLFVYATKTDLQNAAGVDASSFAK